MPSWLNEAVAHLIELEVCPDSPNLQERFVEFRENPNRYSVVLSDQASGQSTRRGASRAAGCSFLASALSTRPAADLKRLVTSSMQHADPIECTTGRSFAAMFRNWTVEMCDSVSPSTDRSPNSRRLSLAGTSFAVERPSNGSRTLNIQFPAAAMLQVTVAQGGSGEETLNTAESAGRTAR